LQVFWGGGGVSLRRLVLTTTNFTMTKGTAAERRRTQKCRKIAPMQDDAVWGTLHMVRALRGHQKTYVQTQNGEKGLEEWLKM